MNKRTFEPYKPTAGHSNCTPQKGYKTHIKARKHAWQNVKLANEVVELGYFNLIASLKKFYSGLPDENDRKIIEIDHMHDLTTPMEMHTFITPHCYLHLQCTYRDEFQVLCLLDDCLIKHEVEHRLTANLFSRHVFEKKMASPLKRYYRMALITRAQYIVQL